MFETANESPRDSPLQMVLETYFIIQKTNKYIEELKSSSHNEVQEAATGDN